MDPAPTDLDALKTAAAAGARLKFLFFWGHQPSPGGPGPSCLSQWYAAPFVVDGARYPTAEHWMMAEKARLFVDKETRERILSAKSPAEAKALGREVRGFSEERWRAAREDIVYAGNLAKFTQHDELGAFLLGTGQRVLVEASPKDRIWGIGLAKDDEAASDPARWRGLNLLGFALMKVRSTLQDGGSAA